MKAVGIYASSRDLSVVEITKEGAKCHLTQLVQETIPPEMKLFPSSLDSDQPGHSEQPQKQDLPEEDPNQSPVIQYLKESFKTEEGVPVFFAFPPEPVILQYFKMLKIPRKEWGVAVRFEARKYLPFDLEQMSSDFAVLPFAKGLDQMEVIFFAVDQKYSRNWTSFLQRIGFGPEASETSWISVLRLLLWNQQLKKEAIKGGILVSVEPDRLGVGLFVEGVPYFSREIRWVSSIVDPDSPDLLESVAGDIRLAKEFHRKNFPRRELSHIYVFGTWSGPALNDGLSRECEMDVIEVDPFLKITGDRPEVISSGLVIAMGCALRGLLKKPKDASIRLGGVERKKRKKLPLEVLLAAEGILAVLLLIGIQIYASSSVKKAQEAYDSVVKNRPVITALPNPLAGVEELAQMKESRQQELSLVRSVIDNRVDLSSKMSVLVEALLDPMWLQKFYWRETFSDDLARQEREIKITGAVYSEGQKEIELINRFSDQLKKPAFFGGLSEAEIIGVKRIQIGYQEVKQFEWIGSSGKRPQ